MKIYFGEGKTEYGPGVQIDLSGEEVAWAIYAYLMAKKTIINGAATIRINGNLIEEGSVYVDPSAFVISKGRKWDGRGSANQKQGGGQE
jgi:hypothetical protein